MKVFHPKPLTKEELMQTCKVLNAQAEIQLKRLARRRRRGQFITTQHIEEFWAAAMPQWYHGAQDNKEASRP